MRMMHIHASLLDIEFIFMHGIKSKKKVRDREKRENEQQYGEKKIQKLNECDTRQDMFRSRFAHGNCCARIIFIARPSAEQILQCSTDCEPYNENGRFWCS